MKRESGRGRESETEVLKLTAQIREMDPRGECETELAQVERYAARVGKERRAAVKAHQALWERHRDLEV